MHPGVTITWRMLFEFNLIELTGLGRLSTYLRWGAEQNPIPGSK